LNPNRFAGDLFADECLLNGWFVNCGRYSLQNALLSSCHSRRVKIENDGWQVDGQMDRNKDEVKC
jgi:hypothetical protein